MENKQYDTPKNTVEFGVKGRFALFSDITTKSCGEKFSYPIPTYGALKGLADSIYHKPTFYWVIDAVRIMNPIRSTRWGVNIRNLSTKGRSVGCCTYLEDVYYQVRAHFEYTNRPEFLFDHNDGKHFSIMNRSIKNGGRRNPYIGTSECVAEVFPCKFGEGNGFYDGNGTWSFGNMYMGIIYPDEAKNKEDKNNITRVYWDAKMEDGYIYFPNIHQCEKKEIVEADFPMKTFSKAQARYDQALALKGDLHV